MTNPLTLTLLLSVLVLLVDGAPPMLPNIGYVGFGYNAYSGNPHSNQFDPGFGQVPVFTLTYNQQQTTSDGKWLIPDNVAVPGEATACSVEGSTQVIQYTSDYQTSLSVDAKVDVSYFKAAFSASTQYKQVDQSTSSNSDVYVSTTGSCQTYLVNLNAFVHPNLSSVFAYQGSLLPTYFDPNNASAFWQFFDLVGTHYATQMTYGSRWGYSFQSTLQQYTTMQNIGLDVTVAASYAGLIKAGVSVTTQYAQQMASNFSSYTSNTMSFGLGVAPPASGSIADWLQNSLSSNLMDPIQYNLVEISTLFGPQYNSNPALQARQGAVSDALAQYCALHLLPNGLVADCDGPPIPPPPPAPVGYAALACAGTTGKWQCHSDTAVVFDGASAVQAEEIVLDMCPGCTILFAITGGNCLAMAFETSKNYWCVEYNTNDLDQLTSAAISCCETNSKSTCAIVFAGCSVPPPVNVPWGAIACVNNCNSYSATSQGFPDRIEAHRVAMQQLQGSFLAIDFNACGAIAKPDKGNGFAASGGDTPQDAINNALYLCQSSNPSCHLVTYSCVSSSLYGSFPLPNSTLVLQA